MLFFFGAVADDNTISINAKEAILPNLLTHLSRLLHPIPELSVSHVQLSQYSQFAS
jgi:hypothetical protein